MFNQRADRSMPHYIATFSHISETFIYVPDAFNTGLEIRLFEKNSRRKNLKTQGKNSITQEQNSRIRQNFNRIPSTKAKNYLQWYFFQLKSWDIT